MKELWNKFKKNKVVNDGVFINLGNGSFKVAYSKYNILKENDIIDFNVLSKSLCFYKKALITNI